MADWEKIWFCKYLIRLPVQDKNKEKNDEKNMQHKKGCKNV